MRWRFNLWSVLKGWKCGGIIGTNVHPSTNKKKEDEDKRTWLEKEKKIELMADVHVS